MADETSTEPKGVSTGATRAAEHRVRCALDLGWRVAALYAGVKSYDRTPGGDGVLPTAMSLPASDRLELELLAAAGYVQRLGIALDDDLVTGLVHLARETDEANGDASTRFRAELHRCHVGLDKEIWSNSEREGRAYELGIMLFDTWSRIHRAYEDGANVAQEWRHVFGGERISYLLNLIDDLQSWLNPGAVTVVRDNVESWRGRVKERLDRGALPEGKDPWQKLRSQAVVWRQLLSGDKEPEAYLGSDERAEVRNRLTGLMWKRYRRLVMLAIPALVAAVGAAVFVGADIVTWYGENSQLAAVVLGTLATAGAAIGISHVSIVHAARNSLRVWSELLWNRALSQVVCRETLRVDEVFPAEQSRGKRLASTARRQFKEGVTGLRGHSSAPAEEHAVPRTAHKPRTEVHP